MDFASAFRTRYIYWLAAVLVAVTLIMNLMEGTTWPRIASSIALLTGFVLMGLYPADRRPAWVRTVILLMLGAAILLLVLRVTGRLV